MPDTSEIDEAVVAKLAGDATLMALLTDGVYVDIAPAGKTKFVIVQQMTHADDYVFEGGAFESLNYMIKAVDKAASGLNAKSAADRIHTLLQDVALTITGYKHCLTRRTERIRYTEVDEIDGNIRWQHRGGRYDVVVS